MVVVVLETIKIWAFNVDKDFMKENLRNFDTELALGEIGYKTYKQVPRFLAEYMFN